MAAAQAGQLALAVGADVAAHVRVMSTTPAPPGVPAQALIKVPAELSASSVRAALAASGAVKAVVPNRVVRIAQAIEEGECLGDAQWLCVVQWCACAWPAARAAPWNVLLTW